MVEDMKIKVDDLQKLNSNSKHAVKEIDEILLDLR